MVYAQKDRFFTLGVKAGLTVTTLAGFDQTDYPGKTHAKIKPTAGITTDFSISNQWSILSGLEYLTKNAGTGMESGDLTITIPHYTTKYLQLPIHIGYKLRMTEDSKIVFHVGPYLAYGIEGEIKWKDVDTRLFHYMDPFEKQLLDRFDYGIGVGITIDKNNFAFSIGYDHGVKNLAKSGFYFPDRPNIDTKEISVHTRCFQATIGWKFRQL
jgi:hypothetical protein